MENLKLLHLLETVLGKSKRTARGNLAFFSPFKHHAKPKLEVRSVPDENQNYTWHCWISNERGKSIFTLFKKLKQPQHILDQLEKIIKIADRKNFLNTTEIEKQILSLPAEYKPLWVSNNSYDYKAAINYLKSRNITIFDILKYRIGYADSGLYKDRIIIPSYDSEGNINYFISRLFRDKDTLKYKNPTFSKDVIGFELFINWNEPVIICEGAFDAIAVKRNAIPLFGKIIQSELKKRIIEEHVSEIYICLDGDALKASIEICERFMSEGIKVFFIKLEEKDAADLGYKKINSLINEAEELSFEQLYQYRMELLWK